MPDYRLSRTQRNEVFQRVHELGLDPASFGWEDLASGNNRIHRLVHTTTRSFLKIDYVWGHDRNGYLLDYWPKTETLYGLGAWVPDWPSLRQGIFQWLAVVKVEDSTPDLWAIAHQERAWLTSTEKDFGGNTPFGPYEQEQILKHLQTIEQYAIKTYELTEAADLTHVREQLHYLTDAARRVGRLDWKNLAASTFLNIVLTLGLDREKAQGLLALATQLLGPLVAGVGRLLSP